VSFATTATVIQDVFSGKYIVCENCDQNVNISHRGVPIIGGGVGDWVEDIDNLSKTIAMRGPILVTDQGVGYDFTISGFYNYVDIFTWINPLLQSPDSSYKSYTIKDVSIDVNNKSNITISLSSNTPFIDDTNNKLKPTFQIYDNHVIVGNGVSSVGTIYGVPGARILRNYDLVVGVLSQNYDVEPVAYSRFVESFSIKYSLEWTDVKSIPTIYHTEVGAEKTRADTSYYADWSQTLEDAGPFVIQKIINNVKIEINTTAYYDENYIDYFDREVGSLWIGHAPLHVLRREGGATKYPLTSYLDPSMNLTAIFIQGLYRDMHWRLIDKNTSGKGPDLVKVSEKWQGILRTDAIL